MPGRPCSHGLLIEALWGSRPPKDPVLSLRSHISRLRIEVGLGNRLQALTGERLQQVPGAAAYRLEVGEGELDLHRFRQRAAWARELLARGEFDGAAPVLAAALGCWRDPPLANLPTSPVVNADAAGLLEEKRATEADYVDVMLALGRHQEVLADLRRATTIDPLAEGPAAQLMLALYRAGRKREALAAYSQTRGAMIQTLGTDPGPHLRDLYTHILADSPALAGPLQPAVTGSWRPGPAAPRRVVRRRPVAPGPATAVPPGGPHGKALAHCSRDGLEPLRSGRYV